MTVEIVPKYGHYEVYIDGRFFCSADDEREAKEEVKSYMTEGE